MDNESPVLETADEIRTQIKELQEKAAKLEAVEAKEEFEEVKVTMPVADGWLKIARDGSNVKINGVTPAEVLFLVAEHNRRAGGNPITDLVPTGTISVDPRRLRERLIEKYGEEKIKTLFPGAEPVMPKTFRRAMSAGIEANLPRGEMLRYEVKPDGTGAAE